MKFTIPFFLCFLLCFSPLSLPAGELNLLEELDSYMGPDGNDVFTEKITDDQDKRGNPLDQMIKHFDAELRLRGFRFLDKAPDVDGMDLDMHRNAGEILVKGSTWAGNNFWTLHTGGWLEVGTQEDTYKGTGIYFRDKEHWRRYLEFNEIHLTFSWKNCDLVLGKKPFQNGISTLYSPADRYDRLDLNDPVDPKKLGSWQAVLDYYRGDTSYAIAIMPVFQPMKVPSIGSRWLAGAFASDILQIADSENDEAGILSEEFVYYFWHLFSDDGELSDIILNREVSLKGKLPSNTPGDYGWFCRAKASPGAWDVFASAYHGPTYYPVAKVKDSEEKAVAIMEFPIVFNLAAGFSNTWKSMEFHGEVLYNHTKNDKDDDYIHYVAGMSCADSALSHKLKLEKIDLTVEYAGESIISDPDWGEYSVGSRKVRICRDDILTSLLITVNEDICLHLLSDIVLWNRSQFYRFSSSYRVASGTVLDLIFEFFNGNDDSYYGRWKGNDRIITILTWRL